MVGRFRVLGKPGPKRNSDGVRPVLFLVMQETSVPSPADELASDKEAVLVQRAKAGDSTAWEEIYGLYHRPVFRYFLGRLGDVHLSEDLAATVFLQAVKGIDSFVYKGAPLLTWLYRIARNIAADHYRSELGRHPAGSGGIRTRIPSFFRSRFGDGEPVEETVGADDPGGAGINVERLDLKDALKHLDESQREIIALHYYAGFSLREVARMLGMNERKVYSVQARALVELRRQLT